jgi:hypothetical protein
MNLNFSPSFPLDLNYFPVGKLFVTVPLTRILRCANLEFRNVRPTFEIQGGVIQQPANR